MATSKSQARIKEDLPTLKNKVVELERQIVEYKTKLDELRRAKATTVVKLEKEYVNTNVPGLNRPEKSKACDKCDEFEKLLDSERKANTQLKRLVEEKGTPAGPCATCPDLRQLLQIEKKNNDQLIEQFVNEKKRTEEERTAKEVLDRALETTHADLMETKNLVEALRIENRDYQSAFEGMKKEHEERMAELAQREEEAKKQVATWEQMYREWMATMERRVNNLQMTNEELQTWLHEENEHNPTTRQ